MDIQRFIKLFYHSCAQEKSEKTCGQNQEVDFIYFWLDMNKTKIDIYQEEEQLRRMKEFKYRRIYKTKTSGNIRPKKISVEEVIYVLYT